MGAICGCNESMMSILVVCAVQRSGLVIRLTVQHVCARCRTLAKEELRNQVGTFRFDLRNLASSKGSKEERKAGISKAKELIVACEDLDQAIQKKDQEKAKKLYGKVTDKLSAFDQYISS